LTRAKSQVDWKYGERGRQIGLVGHLTVVTASVKLIVSMVPLGGAVTAQFGSGNALPGD
jgi:hypothetical protein